jgi:uncharacterized protein (TIGR01777 family)
MKILITGGTGFIGGALCKTLLSAGHELTVLSRKPETVAKRCGAGVTAIDHLHRLTPGHHYDAAINLAGEPIVGPRWTERRKKALIDSRVGVTEQLIGFIAAAEQKPAVLLSGSAVGYYGDQGDRILDENSGAVDGFGHTLCAAWERSAFRASEYGVRVCLMRSGLVIGAGGGFLQPMLLPFKLGLGGHIGNGRQWLSWIHIDDHIAMQLQLLQAAHLSGVFNFTTPNPVTSRDFADILARLLHRPAIMAMPGWLLKLALGEMAGLLLGGQRVLPRRFQEEGFRFRFETLEAALRNVLATA